MNLRSGILILVMAGTAFSQNSIIQKTQNALKPVEHQQGPQSHKAQAVSHATQVNPAKPVTSSKVIKGVVLASESVQKNVDVEAAKKSDDDVLKSATKERKINLTGRRDPFLSPVVAQTAGGSGCSTGKRCLAIDQISLKGIVQSQNGMIAVVVNALDKAYFLHENDPVFNGYVVKITGDSIVFKETVQDKFGKPFTREVTKRIFTPAV